MNWKPPRSLASAFASQADAHAMRFKRPPVANSGFYEAPLEIRRCLQLADAESLTADTRRRQIATRGPGSRAFAVLADRHHRRLCRHRSQIRRYRNEAFAGHSRPLVGRPEASALRCARDPECHADPDPNASRLASTGTTALALAPPHTFEKPAYQRLRDAANLWLTKI